jgi:hypothetical protein
MGRPEGKETGRRRDGRTSVMAAANLKVVFEGKFRKRKVGDCGGERLKLGHGIWYGRAGAPS